MAMESLTNQLITDTAHVKGKNNYFIAAIIIWYAKLGKVAIVYHGSQISHGYGQYFTFLVLSLIIVHG